MDKRRFKSQSPKTRANKRKAIEFIARNPSCTKATLQEALGLTQNEVEFVLKYLRAGKFVAMTRNHEDKIFTYTVTGISLPDGGGDEVAHPNARVFKLSDKEPSPEMLEEMRQRRKQYKNTLYTGSSMSLFEGW